MMLPNHTALLNINTTVVPEKGSSYYVSAGAIDIFSIDFSSE